MPPLNINPQSSMMIINIININLFFFLTFLELFYFIFSFFFSRSAVTTSKQYKIQSWLTYGLWLFFWKTSLLFLIILILSASFKQLKRRIGQVLRSIYNCKLPMVFISFLFFSSFHFVNHSQYYSSQKSTFMCIKFYLPFHRSIWKKFFFFFMLFNCRLKFFFILYNSSWNTEPNRTVFDFLFLFLKSYISYYTNVQYTNWITLFLILILIIQNFPFIIDVYLVIKCQPSKTDATEISHYCHHVQVIFRFIPRY